MTKPLPFEKASTEEKSTSWQQWLLAIIGVAGILLIGTWVYSFYLGTSDSGRVKMAQERALSIMDSQVPDDYELQVDRSSLTDPRNIGEFSYICGNAKLTLLTKERVEQRFIVTMNSRGTGQAEFDGSSDPGIQQAFSDRWVDRCEH